MQNVMYTCKQCTLRNDLKDSMFGLPSPRYSTEGQAIKSNMNYSSATKAPNQGREIVAWDTLIRFSARTSTE